MAIKHSYSYADLSLNFSLPVVCTAIALKWLYEAYLWQRFDFMRCDVLVLWGNLGLSSGFGYCIRDWFGGNLDIWFAVYPFILPFMDKVGVFVDICQCLR